MSRDTLGEETLIGRTFEGGICVAKVIIFGEAVICEESLCHLVCSTREEVICFWSHVDPYSHEEVLCD